MDRKRRSNGEISTNSIGKGLCKAYLSISSTYILDAFLVDSLASFSSLLANHDALQQGVNHRDSIGVKKGYDVHLE